MFAFVTRQLGSLLALAVGVSFISALLALWLLGMVSRAHGAAHFNFLLYLGLWGVFILVCNALSSVLSRHGARAVHHVRMSLIRRILATAYDKLVEAGDAKLYNVLTTDVDNIANTLAEMPTFIFNAILLVCCLSYLAFLSWRMFAVLAVGVALAFLLSKVLLGNLSRHARRMRDGEDELFEAYKGMLAGTAQLAVDGTRRSLYYEQDLEGAATRLQRHVRDFRFYWDLNRNMTAAIVLLLLGSMAEASQLLHGESVVTTFMLLLTYCIGAFATVVNLLQLFARSGVSLRKIESLQIGPDQAVAQPVATVPQWRRLLLSGVEFAYPGPGGESRFVLGPIDLEVRRGEVVFVTGGNGSGKSTLLKLLLGLQEPTGGRVLLDDVNLEGAAARCAYQGLFAIVLSEFHLFWSLLGPEGNVVQDATALELLKMFSMDSVVTVAGGRLSTVRLSQGQRKRMALIAALAQDKDIYVLDEWAADQDPQHRKLFYEKVIPWMRSRGKTIIAVTHDERYFNAADRCVELEMGRVRDDSGIERTMRAVAVE